MFLAVSLLSQIAASAETKIDARRTAERETWRRAHAS